MHWPHTDLFALYVAAIAMLKLRQRHESLRRLNHPRREGSVYTLRSNCGLLSVIGAALLTASLPAPVQGEALADLSNKLKPVQNKLALLPKTTTNNLGDYVTCRFDTSNVSTQATRAQTDLQAAAKTLTSENITLGDEFGEVVAQNLITSSGLKAAIAQAVAQHQVTSAGKSEAYMTQLVHQVLAPALLPKRPPPDDIACTMILLPWQVAADSFGRHVADQFMTFQVIVRNVNTTQEFLLHDVAISLDGSDYYAGIDKMIARNSQAHGNYYDRRNYFLRALEVAGDIAAGAAPFGSGDIQHGIAVFRSAFVPGLGKLLPDRYISQLLALNDLSFSSSMAYKIVVPIKGTVPFVTFLPVDIFARKITATANVQHSASTQNDKKWHYKNWSPEELYQFLVRADVQVSGIHVQEVHNDKPSLTGIDCTGSAAGELDLSKSNATSKSITCGIRGQNLDKIEQIQLRNSTETTDPLVADAPITLAGGQNIAATATFLIADLSKLTGASYAVFMIQAADHAALPTTVAVTIKKALAPPSK